MDLFQLGNSVMANHGFDIHNNLALQGVKLNISLFLKGKCQLPESELVEIKKIASVRIYVERSECINNSHIFDICTPSSKVNQAFFVCVGLSNFHPPLCTYVMYR